MSKTISLSFQNNTGVALAARLELPSNQLPTAYAIFAHCFTCSKNLGAVRNISKALTKNGIAVLRFDFTGLGNSEGDFADTNFSSNVEDLLAAAQFLEQNYAAPSLLVGHSLGGAAVLFASSRLPSIKAVATIGAPSEPEHVSHLLASGETQLEKEGIASISIGGRPFTVKKQFLEDIKNRRLQTLLPNLRKAFLFLHSPQDRTVPIENAQKLYIVAHHPKSFISLDSADHLLSKKEDSLYTGGIIASWAKRYLVFESKLRIKTNSQVAAELETNNKFTTQVQVGKHQLIADEPESFGGNNFGPSPYEYISSGLGACTVMTLQMYARRKKWDLQKVIVHIDHDKRLTKSDVNSESSKNKIDWFTRKIELIGDLNDTQRQRLLEIANRCPVHRTLESDIRILTELV